MPKTAILSLALAAALSGALYAPQVQAAQPAAKKKDDDDD